jgi:hypothetical protein
MGLWGIFSKLVVTVVRFEPLHMDLMCKSLSFPAYNLLGALRHLQGDAQGFYGDTTAWGFNF